MKLPALDPAFRWSREPWGQALRCQRLEPEAQHLFTTKQLQLRAGDAQSGAWEQAAASVSTGADRVLRIKQVHGRAVRVVRAEDLSRDVFAARPEADAIVSNAPGVVLAVQVADCLPLLIVDPRSGAAGAVHAGWRGTCAAIGVATVHTLTREFGSRPADLLVAIGPGIGSCCYEVGPELIKAFQDAGASETDLARWFLRAHTHSLRLDLWTANRDQLIAAGVLPDRVYVSGLCTQTHADLFESYRVEGANAGRMAALIRVPGDSAHI